MPETTQSDLVERLTEMAALYRRAICDDNEDAQTFADAAAEITRLRKRLELREPDWPEEADGIACRNDTIALLDERVERQSAELNRLRAHCEAMEETIRLAEVRVTAARSFLVIDSKENAERHLSDVVQLLAAYRKEGGA
ncbi:hypothetical protein [uncultured Novosphingobium sp.]|uniref:hypothetical protein n=1 Tax=uncultured Novosphingobium sp. TaxID=292277 RepID=UPI0025975D61|nr:hypothetical protein [uncultured Novosphingobium sp.]